MATRRKIAPRTRTMPGTKARTVSRSDLKRATRSSTMSGNGESRVATGGFRPGFDPSTANDLNAGRGTEGPRDDNLEGD
jgi:hypothetical protein